MKPRNKRETVTIDKNTYQIIRIVKEQEDANLYIGIQNRKKYLLKEFSSIDDFDCCLKSYERLSPLGLEIPEIVSASADLKICVESYATGRNAAELIVRGELQPRFLEQIRAMADVCEQHNLAIDYYPTNFRICGSHLVYTGSECRPLTDDNSFEKNGVRYWMNSSDLIESMVRNQRKDKKC